MKRTCLVVAMALFGTIILISLSFEAFGQANIWVNDYFSLRWSPDGTAIAFVANFAKKDDKGGELLFTTGIGKIKPDGSGLEIIISNPWTPGTIEAQAIIEEQVCLRAKEEEKKYPGDFKPPAPAPKVIKPVFSPRTQFEWTNSIRIVFSESFTSFTRFMDLYIWTVNSDGTNLRQIVKSNEAYSPSNFQRLENGTIAFLMNSEASPERKTSGGGEYWHSLNPDNGRIEQIINKSAYDLAPPYKVEHPDSYRCAISPDGKKLMYNNTDRKDPDIFVFNSEKNATINITNVKATGQCYSASWSPDSKKITFVFLSSLGTPGRKRTPPFIWVINSDGTNSRPLSMAQGAEVKETRERKKIIEKLFNPAGMKVEDIESKVSTMAISGDDKPVWSFDGKSIAFVREYSLEIEGLGRTAECEEIKVLTVDE